MIRKRDEDIKTFADFVERIKRDGLYNSFYCGTALFVSVDEEDGKEYTQSIFYNTSMNQQVIDRLQEIEDGGGRT